MKYAARKLLTLLFTMVIVSFLTFLAFQLIAGDPVTNMLGTEATGEKVAALQEQLGLNRPLLVRYGLWIAGFVTGDLGTSYSYSIPVTELLGQKLPVTLALSLLAFVLTAAISIPLGVRSARQAEQRLDGLRTSLNQLLMALPPFFSGILLTWIFGILLKWFTPGKFPGLSAAPLRALGYLLFPALAIALPRVAMTVRMLRSTILGEMKKDYVRTAISRGNDRREVLYGHVLKNAMVPVVAFLAQTLAEIIAGSIVVEQVFALPGLGRLLLASINNRDYPVVQAIVVILAFWVVLAGILSDLVSRRLDPRLRVGGDEE